MRVDLIVCAHFLFLLGIFDVAIIRVETNLIERTLFKLLILKRVTRFNEFYKDTVDNRIIGPGEYFYEDIDIDTGKFLGTRISAQHYWELKEADMKENFDETYYNTMESEKEYKDALREAEMELREKNILKQTNLKRLM